MSEKVRGMIQEVKPLTTKTNKTWYAVKVNNVEYSHFPKAGQVFNFVATDTIEFEVVINGKYTNMENPIVCALPASELGGTTEVKIDDIEDCCEKVKTIATELGYDLQNLTDAKQKIIVTVLMTVTKRH